MGGKFPDLHKTSATRNVYLLPCRPKAKLKAVSYEATNQNFIVNRCDHQPQIRLHSLTR